MKSYIPRKEMFKGVMLSLVGALGCLLFMQQLPLWTNGQTFGLSSLTIAIIFGMLLGNTVYPKIASSFTNGINYSNGQLFRCRRYLWQCLPWG